MKKTVISRSCKALMSFVFYLASLRSSESCQGVGRNTHFYPFPTCAQAFWVEGEQLQSPGRKCGRFLPTVSVQPAGASTDSEAMHHLVSLILGWRLSAVILPDWIGDVAKLKYLTSSAADPFLWLPLPSSLLNLSAHIREILENS